jgi:hypothetical protein
MNKNTDSFSFDNEKISPKSRLLRLGKFLNGLSDIETRKMVAEYPSFETESYINVFCLETENLVSGLFTLHYKISKSVLKSMSGVFLPF